LLGHLEHLFNYYTSIIANRDLLVNQRNVAKKPHF